MPITELVPRSPLTQRERDIVPLVGEGMSYSEIGATLRISARTVEKHVQNVAAKLPGASPPYRRVALYALMRRPA